MVSKTICPYPFVHQQIQPDGEIRFCCAAKPQSNIDSEGKSCYVSTHKLTDAWNSESIKKLRLELINGEKPDCCSHCWIRENEDNTSGTSMRLDYISNTIPIETIKDRINYAIDNSGELHDKPFDFQVMTGNLCNLACKMCTPQYSTNFSKFFKNKGIISIKDIKFQKNSTRFTNYDAFYNQTYDWPITHPLSNVFADYIDSLKEIFLLGGEPTLLDGTFEFLEELKSKNKTKNILLRLSTNCTNITPRLLENLDNFKNIRINVSLDGKDEIAYIQRTPSNWELIKKNLDKLIDYKLANPSRSIDINIHSVITSLNLHHITDFWSYMNDEYGSVISYSCMGVLEEDDNFTVHVVPKKIAKYILDKSNLLKNSGDTSFGYVLDKFSYILETTNFSDTYENMYFQLDQIQKFHPEIDIKKIYSIYYNDSL